MRRKLVGLAATALLIAASAQPASAQARGYVGFGAGVTLPLGSFKDEAKLGWLGQVLGGVRPRKTGCGAAGSMGHTVVIQSRVSPEA